jgi:hypothetical protein
MSKEFQMHQLLATVGTRDTQALKLINEAKNTFKAKDAHFNGRLKTYKADNDDGTNALTDESEIIEMVSTVKDKLDYVSKSIINAVDTAISKEETNSSGKAKAELEIGGTTFTLSATSLLALEKRLIGLRGLYNEIPTLDPTKAWTFDEDKGYYVSDTVKRNRIVKKIKSEVVVQATKEFPAQVVQSSIDEKVGVYTEVHHSSKLPVERKAKYISNIDDILEKIAIARAKANTCVVVENPIMGKILDFINS